MCCWKPITDHLRLCPWPAFWVSGACWMSAGSHLTSASLWLNCETILCPAWVSLSPAQIFPMCMSEQNLNTHWFPMGKGSSDSRMLLQVFNLEDWGTRGVGCILPQLGCGQGPSWEQGCRMCQLCSAAQPLNCRDDKDKHTAAFSENSVQLHHCLRVHVLIPPSSWNCCFMIVFYFLIVKEA